MAGTTAKKRDKLDNDKGDRLKTDGGPEITGGPGLGAIYGSATGEDEHTTVAGGWAGTDDATSTAPSDEFGTPPELVAGISEGMTTPEVDRWIQSEEEKFAEEEAEAEENRELSDLREEESLRIRERQIKEAARKRRKSTRGRASPPFSKSLH